MKNLRGNSVWNTTHWFSEGISSYQGLEVDLNRHWTNGLQFRAVYTFSKTLDDGLSPLQKSGELLFHLKPPWKY